MDETLHHPEGTVTISNGSGIRTVEVTTNPRNLFVARASCVTSYPTHLIEAILKVKGISWLCDEISRDEEPSYVQKHLLADLDAFFNREEFEGARVLDFGCGSGASTAILARTYPLATFTGVELEPAFLDIARLRAEHYRFKNLRFLQSPGPMHLPENMGTFDIIVLSAVVEHLLPDERRELLPFLWAHVKPGGALFLDETPHRWFPIELHTTMLPLINYLPDQLTARVVRRFSKRDHGGSSWNHLLRAGIRGTTLSAIRASLTTATPADTIRPRSGISLVGLWFSKTDKSRFGLFKRISHALLRIVEVLTGTAIIPDIAVAFRKPCIIACEADLKC